MECLRIAVLSVAGVMMALGVGLVVFAVFRAARGEPVMPPVRLVYGTTVLGIAPVLILLTIAVYFQPGILPAWCG